MAASGGTWPGTDGGRPHFSADSFYFLRVPGSDAGTRGQDDDERAYLAGYRWRTLDEVRPAMEEVWLRRA